MEVKKQFTRRFTLTAATIGVSVLGTAALAQPAHAWDKFGHEVIAQIAYDHMTPTARANADALIKQLASDPAVTPLESDVKPYTFVSAAAWQDDVKSLTRMWATWHYIDLPSDPKLTPADVAAYSDKDGSNVYQVLTTYCMPTLENSSAPAADRARALGMFLHFAGDIHQPFHAVEYERGANEVAITPLPAADTTYGGVDNLHAFWDGAYRYGVKNGQIILAIPTRDIPREAAPVESVAHTLEASYMPTDPAQVADLDPADWALESQQDAITFAIPDATPPTLSADYVQKAHDLACRRLALAGLRIAAILNVALGGPTNPAPPAATAMSTPIAPLPPRHAH